MVHFYTYFYLYILLKYLNVRVKTETTFSYIDNSRDIGKHIFISGKVVNDFNTIDYLGLIPILIKSIQELTERVATLETLINN